MTPTIDWVGATSSPAVRPATVGPSHNDALLIASRQANKPAHIFNRNPIHIELFVTECHVSSSTAMPMPKFSFFAEI